MGPLFAQGLFGLQWALILAFPVGILFGFFLERAGFASARKLTAVFYLTDMAVLKAIFTAIITAMLGLMYLRHLGLIRWSEVNIEPTFIWPQIMGGLLFGVGFVLGGYCPGTCVVAAVSGKLDAIAFIAGIIFGLGIFAVGYPVFQHFYLSGSMGVRTLPTALHLRHGILAFIVVAAAIAAFWGAEKLETRFARKATSIEGK